MLNRSLSEGFGQLRSLVELNLRYCQQLRALPEGIPPRILPLTPLLLGMHCALTDRDIRSSVVLNRSLSEGFGQLKSLVTLNLMGCCELKELCEGIPPRILPLPATLAILA